MLIQTKLAKFPENEIAMLEVVLGELQNRKIRRENFAEALQGLVKIQDSFDIHYLFSSVALSVVL
jgi:ADP-dependent phosphofructokinase/glucokinase